LNFDDLFEDLCSDVLLMSRSKMSSWDKALLMSRFISDRESSCSCITPSPFYCFFCLLYLSDRWEAISSVASLSCYCKEHLIEWIDFIDFRDFNDFIECSDSKSSSCWEAFIKKEETTDEILSERRSFFCFRHCLKILWILFKLSVF
jgi:hypothetical protein